MLLMMMMMMMMMMKIMTKFEEEKAEKESEKESEKDSERESEKESERSERSEEEKNDEEKEEGKKDKGEKKKRKIRLDMHLEQIFVDSSDAYVWLYDPIPWYYWILGGGICLIVIMFCLFPLWPKKIRHASGWLSWIAVLFLLAVLVVGIIKYLLFSVLYILSARKLRFWIMPNLTKDVGFIKSFWPLYEFTYTGEYIGDAAEDSEDKPEENAGGYNDDSDSNESGKSGFEFVDKNKDD